MSRRLVGFSSCTALDQIEVRSAKVTVSQPPTIYKLKLAPRPSDKLFTNIQNDIHGLTGLHIWNTSWQATLG